MSNPQAQSDRRRFTRIFFDAQVSFKTKQGLWQSELIDISLNGVLAELPENFQGRINDRVQLEVHLDGSTTLSMRAVIRHINDKSVGLVCQEIDIESMTHLRKIIEHNTNNESLVYRELEHLGEWLND